MLTKVSRGLTACSVMQPSIVANGLTKRFGDIVAVDQLDISIQFPGLVGLLGPNGAGKTTTMRMLTGFLGMTDGTASVAGFDVFDEPTEVKRRVGYLPELPPLYPELRVGEYLAFVAEIREVPSARRLVRVGEVMEQVGLTGWENTLLGSLSKGYRQRVGLAQALVHDPQVLILDEPTSGLDPIQLTGIRALIRSLADDRVVLLSSHVLGEVETLCDRVVVIHRGRKVGDGTPASLAAQAGLVPWVEVGVAGEGILASLAALPEATRVHPLGDERYRVEGAEIAALGAWAATAGRQLTCLVDHTPSLTEVFTALVGE
jgi:ABC-2 type transport system ATP-binding protein